MKPKPKQDDPAQSKRFIETAKELGVKEDPVAFERAFKKVVKSGAPSPDRGKRSS